MGKWRDFFSRNDDPYRDEYYSPYVRRRDGTEVESGWLSVAAFIVALGFLAFLLWVVYTSF